METLPVRLQMYLKFHEFYGLKEIPGPKNNPVIMNWFKDIGKEWVQNDETAWCSCLINWLAWFFKVERSGELTARSWLNVGLNIPLEQAKLGDVVIFWRESINSWKGHVGLFNGYDDRFIYCAGGNQNNQVNISPYSINGTYHGFMACRRLRTLEELKNVA